MSTLNNFKKFTDSLPIQGGKMPVLFTSHGNPMDIIKSREERVFWNTLYDLGKELQNTFEITAALVVSAHWCTNDQTLVNVSHTQQQIYDYYGFPKEYYDVIYNAKGAPDIAKEVVNLVSSAKETIDWGLDHGAWPMLMHLFPDGNVPVFQMSINYNANPNYHYELGKQLKSLRKKGVLIIGSGAFIHNIRLGMQKMMQKDTSLYGWEAEYDDWLKKQIEARNFNELINYTTSHKYGILAAPTPDHYVPSLYSLGLMEKKDEISFFFEGEESLTVPAFGERSFLIHQM
ncbi:class III extradiol ring-cleavage dioxygenase [uncultured Aquimarina sp.]|uniref:dioxygenase family protein n=1 Tax=uncultured Aquimarina sp. TaxID=575652 RepID=UPI00261F86EE|nr:class III extradiol ring-cleavage dioxygenase [uncultured Aquimarina sp.]